MNPRYVRISSRLRVHHYVPCSACWNESTNDEDEADVDDGEWVEEDVGIEGVADDLLQLEFHADCAGHPEKCC